MERGSDPQLSSQNPTDGGRRQATEKEEEKKAKLVVIMGPTGSGKSKLAIDLAAHFPIEIINADSMQVYHGLDVLTNKVPLHDQKGTPSLSLYFCILDWFLCDFVVDYAL